MGCSMMKRDSRRLVLFFKTHIDGFTNAHGTFVPPHEDKRAPAKEQDAVNKKRRELRSATDERTRQQRLTDRRLSRQQRKVVRQLIHAPPLALTEIPDTKAARQAAFDHAMALARQLVQQDQRLHNPCGLTIQLGTNGLRHAKQLTGDIRAVALFYHLPEVLEQAVYVKSEQPDARKQQRKPNIVAYHKLAMPIAYQDDRVLAILHLEQDDKGNVYYQGEIAEMAKPAGISVSDATPGVRVHGRRQALLTDYIHQLLHVKRDLSYLATFSPAVPLLTKAWSLPPGALILFFVKPWSVACVD